MNDINKTSKNTKSLNEMPLHERMEYQKVHDRADILQASMKGANVELKTLGQKKHPLTVENVQSN